MYPTVEVRWFFRGRLPDQVTSWYRELPGPLSSAETRVDRYLRLDEGEAVGIKLREGNLEIKRRVEAFGKVSFPNRVTGRLEHWRKWSFALGIDTDAGDYVAGSDSDWLAVNKTRQLRRYLVEGGRLLALPVSDVERGCEVELAQVTLLQSWWSIALEAFGPEGELRQTLESVAERVFATPPPITLTVEASFSYPQWLALPAGP
ncbi:MAG: hypothetical protein R3300_02660 [Candidatus Promineifilaceae bacterium]|nr:hypothetical protein [Candidatus Promineifilaceae bacterium]